MITYLLNKIRIYLLDTIIITFPRRGGRGCAPMCIVGFVCVEWATLGVMVLVVVMMMTMMTTTMTMMMVMNDYVYDDHDHDHDDDG